MKFSPAQSRPWVALFRAPRTYLPSWAADSPHHLLYGSTASGRPELYAWHLSEGWKRQLTDRINGTTIGRIDPSGKTVWWFDDDGAELGEWRCIPFRAGSTANTSLNLPKGRSAGVALGNRLSVVGMALPSEIQIWSIDSGLTTHLIDRGDQSGHVIGMSRDDTLISVLGKVEMRQGRAFGFRIITLDGKTVDSLLSSPNEELALGPWSPITGDQRLLVSVRRDGNSHCAVWSPSAHRLQEFGSELPGNVELSWYPNGTEVLVVHHFRGRSNLRCASLAGKGVRDLNTPVGSIASASVRPDGEVWFEWSDGQHAHKVMSDRGTIIRPPSKRLRAGTVYNDFSVGDIHSFVAVPRHKSPYPTVDSCSWRARFSP